MQMVYSSWINKQGNLCYKTSRPEHRNKKVQLLRGSRGHICQRLMLQTIGQDNQGICAVLLLFLVVVVVVFVYCCCCLVARPDMAPFQNQRGGMCGFASIKMTRRWSRLSQVPLVHPRLSHSPKPEGITQGVRYSHSPPPVFFFFSSLFSFVFLFSFLLSVFHSWKLSRRHGAGY